MNPAPAAVIRSAAGPVLLLLLMGLAAPAVVGQDSVRVVAGPHYRARSPLHRHLLGGEYRTLWTTPFRAPVLDLASFAGGLTPVRRGGFKQTRALRLRGADGREYNFRSIDKELTPALPPHARETLLDWLRQDQTRAQLPTAAPVATSLLDAVGVLNPGPRVMVMPDDPRLGEFRAEFAGMLGTIEVHANEGEHGAPSFAGAPQVIGSERLLERLEESPADRVDARAFLRARLMDVFLGDYDRHAGQWRWARRDSMGVRWWVPVPEDRDYAFVHYEGLLLDLARSSGLGRMVRFEERYPPILAMMANSLELNRRLLAELPRPAWDSAAVALRAALTDPVIEAAVRRMPPEHFALRGPELIRKLRARRDRLPEMAAAFYAALASPVEVHGTDQADRLEVVRADDGSVDVRLYAPGAAAPYYRRTLHPAETEELRVFLHGGDDRAEVRGSGAAIAVRVVGGGGDDALRDRSSGPTVLYDHRGENRFAAGPGTRISRREPREPEIGDGLLPTLPRDWGSSITPFGWWAGWEPHAQLVLGGGPSWTRYAFRHHPYATRVHLRVLYAPLHGRGGVEVSGDLRRESSPVRLELLARASNLDATRVQALGNDAPEPGAGPDRLWHRRVLLRPRLHLPLGGRAALAAGAVLKHTAASGDAPPGAALAPYGAGPLGQVGAEAGVRADWRDDPRFPRRGVQAGVNGLLYPPLWGVRSAFGRWEGSASGHVTLPFATRPVLSSRVGGGAVLGDFPYHEAVFLGGSESLRGYQYQRFAGDRAVYGTVELRVPVTRAELVARGDLGLSVFHDVGRVYHRGGSPGGWHAGTGASLWFATPLAALSLDYARGDEHRLHLRLGMPF